MRAREQSAPTMRLHTHKAQLRTADGGVQGGMNPTINNCVKSDILLVLIVQIREENGSC